MYEPNTAHSPTHSSTSQPASQHSSTPQSVSQESTRTCLSQPTTMYHQEGWPAALKQVMQTKVSTSVNKCRVYGTSISGQSPTHTAHTATAEHGRAQHQHGGAQHRAVNTAVHCQPVPSTPTRSCPRYPPCTGKTTTPKSPRGTPGSRPPPLTPPLRTGQRPTQPNLKPENGQVAAKKNCMPQTRDPDRPKPSPIPHPAPPPPHTATCTATLENCRGSSTPEQPRTGSQALTHTE